MLPWVPAVVVGEPLRADPVFVDQRGDALRWSQLAGQAFAVTFIYTRCRETAECPATSAKFADLQRELPANAHLLEVTIDPAFDRPAVLHRYGALFGADPSHWTIATGDPQTVLTFAERFNVTVTPGLTPAALEHGEAIAVFDTHERLVSLTAGNSWQPREILAELQSASGGSGNLFDRITLWFRNFGIACGAVLSAGDRLTRPVMVAVVLALFALLAGTSIVVLRALRAYLAR
jgi:cytochrome oxidase Cu insertion factor (SCO1/SenC/PrrC family)